MLTSPPASGSSGPPRGLLLAAGGCHVNGYPLGQPWSFTQLAADALGCDCARIAPIGLRDPSTLINFLASSAPPDILVLQFGNYEVPWPVSRHFRTITAPVRFPKTHRASSTSSSFSNRHKLLPADQVFRPTASWRSRVLLKQGYATVAQNLPSPLFDARFVRQGLRSLLERLTPFHIPHTVVVSPLPCADHMARRFRLDCRQIFKEESEAANAIWVDAGAALGYSDAKSARDFSIYADERHLNATGHRLLAQALLHGIQAASRNDAPADFMLAASSSA